MSSDPNQTSADGHYRRKSSNNCFVVGITGPSGSGKSTLSGNLVNVLNKGTHDNNVVQAYFFPEDPRYFLAPKAVSYRDQDPDSETPEFIHWDDYYNDLKKSICLVDASMKQNKGNGDPSTSSLSTTEERTVVWIIDHFMLLHDPRVVNCLDAFIFLDPCLPDKSLEEARHHDPFITTCNVTSAPPAATIPSLDDASILTGRDTCRERRVQRDPHRPQSEKQLLRQYYNTAVWPAYLRYTHGPAERYLAEHPDRSLRVDCLRASQEQILALAFAFVQRRLHQHEST